MTTRPRGSATRADELVERGLCRSEPAGGQSDAVLTISAARSMLEDVATDKGYERLNAFGTRLADGIDAMIAQESIGQTYGLTVGPMGEVAIMVPESQVKDAKEILASMDSGELEVGEDNQIPDSYDNKDPKPE